MWVAYTGDVLTPTSLMFSLETSSSLGRTLSTSSSSLYMSQLSLSSSIFDSCLIIGEEEEAEEEEEEEELTFEASEISTELSLLSLPIPSVSCCCLRLNLILILLS